MRKKHAEGKYEKTSLYLNSLMITARDFGHTYKYTNYQQAIWKGVNPNADFDPKAYEVGAFG